MVYAARRDSPSNSRPSNGVEIDFGDMTSEDQAELEIDVAADPDNGPIYLAAVNRANNGKHGIGVEVIAVLLAAAVVCWLILRL